MDKTPLDSPTTPSPHRTLSHCQNMYLAGGIVSAAFIQMRKAITLHSSAMSQGIYMRNQILPAAGEAEKMGALCSAAGKSNLSVDKDARPRRRRRCRDGKAVAFKLHFHCGRHNTVDGEKML